jgi:hypothetical protein
MGRHIEALVGRINRIHADRGDAPQRLWVPTHGTLDECAIVALMDRTDTPVVATLMVGINEEEAAVSEFAINSFARLPPDCHRAIAFVGFDNDPRELHDIPEVCAKAERLLFDKRGNVRPFIRLLCWNDVDTPTHRCGQRFVEWRRSMGIASMGSGAFTGILFLAALTAGLRKRIVNTPDGMRWMWAVPISFEMAVQTSVFGRPGKTQLDAGEVARFFRRRRAK